MANTRKDNGTRLTYSAIATMARMGHLSGYSCQSRWSKIKATVLWSVVFFIFGTFFGMWLMTILSEAVRNA